MRVADSPAPPACASSNLLANVKWDVEEAHLLQDFVDRHPLPHVALVTKGQYMDVGLPSVANPTLKPYLLVYAKHSRLKIIGQVVKTKDGRPIGLSAGKLAIPVDYEGFFEILSEDGRTPKSLESVAELSDHCVDLCLVRQMCKAYLPDKNGELKNLHNRRSVNVGEVLTVVGRFYLKATPFLRCFDEAGRSLFFKMRQKAKFSPIAKQSSVSGVHTASNLSAKRLPLNVRLVHGRCPANVCKMAGGNQPTLRLQNVVRERFVFAYCLQRPEGRVVTIPLDARIKLAPSTNRSQIAVHPEYRQLCDWCAGAQSTLLSQMSTVDDNDHHHLLQCIAKQPLAAGGESAHSAKSTFSSEPTDEEIDQLYDYIRGDPDMYNDRADTRPSDTRRPGARLYQPNGRLLSADRLNTTQRCQGAPAARRQQCNYQIEDRFFNFPSGDACHSRAANRSREPRTYEEQSTAKREASKHRQGGAPRARPKSLFIPETSPFFQCPPAPMGHLLFAGQTPGALYPPYAYEYGPSPSRYVDNAVSLTEWTTNVHPAPVVMRQKYRHYPGVYAYEV